MALAYLLASYPMTSTTFIRREIEALERAGVSVQRYAAREWDGDLVDQADIEEKRRTHYLLTGNGAGLFLAFMAEIVSNPGGMARAIGAWWKLLRNGRGGVIRHFAYLMQAAYFKRTSEKQDITHVHCHFATNATAVAMLSRLLGGPTYSFTVHGPDELADAPLLSFPLKIEHAKFVAAITHFCKSQLIRFSSLAYEDKIKIIHCALKMDEFSVSPPPNNQTFICIGRLCAQKGQAQIPAAVAALLPEFPEMKVVLVGDGDTRAEIEAAIERYNVEGAVEIAGWKANAEVRDLLGGARALLLPSYAEGLPVVIMEALALGRPAISTYIAGIPELVDEGCGWIIPAGSQDDLIEAMRAALTAPLDEIAALGVEGRRRIEAGHDIDKEAAKLAVLFSS